MPAVQILSNTVKGAMKGPIFRLEDQEIDERGIAWLFQDWLGVSEITTSSVS